MLLILRLGIAGQSGPPTVRTILLSDVAEQNWTAAMRIINDFHMAADSDLQSDSDLFGAVVLTLIRSGKEAQAHALMDAQHGGLSPAARFKVGTVLAGAGQFRAAIDLLQEMPASDRDEAFYFNLALAQSHAGLHDEARANFFHAIDAQPNYVEAYLHIGLDYAQTGRQTYAVPWLLRASQLQPERADISYALFDLLTALGYTETVSKLLPAALARNPRSALLQTSQAELALANGDVPGARTAFDRVLARQPDCVEALIGRARVAALESDEQAARTLLERARFRSPLSPANAALAHLESSAGHYSEAIPHFRAACAVYCSPTVRTEYAHTLFELGDSSAALNILTTLTASDNTAAVHQLLVRVYRSLGRRTDADHENQILQDLHQRSDEALRFVAPKDYIQ